MTIVAQIATYVSYLFVITAYTFKIIKYPRMPMHLRWELFPIAHEKGRNYGGSYLEEEEWWDKPRQKSIVNIVVYLLKKYFLFLGYFKKDRKYWVSLYPWHLGFYLIVLFHVLAFSSAAAMLATGITVSPTASAGGATLYYLTMVVAVASFILGSVGSIGMFIIRRADASLKAYAAPVNYFNYTFFLIVFLSGLFSWYFFDPTLGTYREFWKSLMTFNPGVKLETATFAHIILFSLFLLYLPFTRSTHYITILFSYFNVLWDDKPNRKGSDIGKKLGKLLEQPVSWSAPHIQQGKKWGEVVSGK